MTLPARLIPLRWLCGALLDLAWVRYNAWRTR